MRIESKTRYFSHPILDYVFPFRGQPDEVAFNLPSICSLSLKRIPQVWTSLCITLTGFGNKCSMLTLRPTSTPYTSNKFKLFWIWIWYASIHNWRKIGTRGVINCIMIFAYLMCIIRHFTRILKSIFFNHFVIPR